MRPPRTTAAAAIALALCVGIALSGCGADQNGDQISPPLTASQPTTAAGTSSTVADGSTDTGRTTTVPTAKLPGSGKPTVLLGDENTPEEFVLGQLYAYALRAEGYDVAVSRNIGVPSVAQQAMREGSLDVYPDYVSAFDQQVAGDSRRYATLADALAAAHRYAARNHLVLLDPTPFSDVSGLAVSSTFAAENHIRSLTALAAGPLVIIGAPLEYSHLVGGLSTLSAAYGLRPAYVTPVAIGEQYAALDDNTVQAAYAQSTDPEFEGRQYVMLSDPLHVSGYGNVIPVTTAKVIAAEGPAYVATLNRVDALLTMRVIRGLNAEVQTNHADPGQVAEEFLQAHGLVPGTSQAGST